VNIETGAFSMTIDPLPQTTAALLLTFVFASAALPKLADLPTFAAVVHNYRILPRLLVKPFAYVLPAVEVAVAVLLLLPATRPVGAAAASLLLGIFAVAISLNIRRGRTEIDCGCFNSSLRQPISGWIVLRNVMLVLVAAVCLPAVGTRAFGGFDACVALLASSALAALYLSVGFVTRRPPPPYEDNFHASLNGP
jgi:uncharacterized membrane protein YphA (DoxX/SURF4 family)